MLMKHMKAPCLASKLGAENNKGSWESDRLCPAQSMTNASAIVTTVAPAALPFTGR